MALLFFLAFQKERVTMESWSLPIFSTELACRVQQIYMTQLDNGKSANEAVSELQQTYCAERCEPEKASIFWMAIAAVQLETHTLLLFVQKQAIAWINHEFAELEKSSDFLKSESDEDLAYTRAISTLKCKLHHEKLEKQTAKRQ